MRHPRGRAALLASLAGALIVSVVVPRAGAGPAQAEPATGDPPSITLVDRSPWVAADGTIEVDIATTGDAESSLLRVRVHDEVDSVEELERSMADDVGRVLHRSPAVPVGFVTAAPDGTRTVRVPTSSTVGDSVTARLPDPGVYPLVVTLEDGAGVVSEIRTPVVRLGTPDEPLSAPRLQLIVDLSVPPTIEPDGRRELEGEELDRLRRLAAVLDGSAVTDPADRVPDGGPLGLTVSVSPDTLEALTASRDERSGPVLDALVEGRADRTALGLPTVPLSAPAMLDADLDLYLLALLENGRSTIDDRLDIDVEPTVWDAADGFDDASAELLVDAGITQVLVDAPGVSADSAAIERPLVDAGPHDVDAIEPVQMLLTDQATSRALTARAAGRADAGHVALAELLLRDDGNETLVLLEIDDAPSDSLLLPTLTLLTAPGSPIEVGPVGTGRGSGSGAEAEPDPAVGPAAELFLPQRSTDLTDIAPQVRRTSSAVDSFAGLVGAESARADALRLQIATSLATGVDDDRRIELLDQVGADVDEAFGAVSLTGQTDLNLTSRSGTLPLQIHNRNDFPIRVLVRMSSDRLRFPEGEHFEIEASEEITRIDVPVQAQATGSVPTFVQLATPDGQVVLDDRRLDVRSTAISGVGLALSLGALAVLVIWWARTWHRTRRDGGRLA